MLRCVVTDGKRVATMNGWVQVATIDELPENRIVPKVANGTNIVLVRSGHGISALRDRCPHRFVPLSLGKIEDGVIHCAYHGLRFGLDGACVFNPHADDEIPANSKVASYEVKQVGAHIFIRIETNEGGG